MRVRLAARGRGTARSVRTLARRSGFGDELIVPGPAAARPAMLDLIRAAGGEIRGLTAEEGRLDELYPRAGRGTAVDPPVG